MYQRKEYFFAKAIVISQYGLQAREIYSRHVCVTGEFLWQPRMLRDVFVFCVKRVSLLRYTVSPERNEKEGRILNQMMNDLMLFEEATVKSSFFFIGLSIDKMNKNGNLCITTGVNCRSERWIARIKACGGQQLNNARLQFREQQHQLRHQSLEM